MKIWIDGNLLDQCDAKLSVFDHGTLYGDGVFEGIRAYSGKIFQCDAHLDRLFDSAAAIRLKCEFSRQQLADAIYASMEANAIEDGYIRLIITRGVGSLGLNPFLCEKSTTVIIADTIALYPKELYETGMPVIIAKTRRCPDTALNPRIKSLNYLNNILAKIECVDAGVSEALMLNARGEIGEAAGDNIFIVDNGRLITSPADAGILLGITRGVVIFLAKRLGLDVAEETILPERLYAAQECFLTGTAAEVIAVTSVDGKPIGDGVVGPVTRKLLSAFQEFIRTDEQVPYTS